jgi:hypothetical protein
MILLFFVLFDSKSTAVQATMGLQALHSAGMGTDGSFGPAIAHTDISPDQFVRVGDIYK